jgi:hypothetical protein
LEFIEERRDLTDGILNQAKAVRLLLLKVVQKCCKVFCLRTEEMVVVDVVGALCRGGVAGVVEMIDAVKL